MPRAARQSLKRHAADPRAAASDQDHAGLAVATAGRPPDISEAEFVRFIGSVPSTYLSVFGLGTIYEHVRLARGIAPNEIHATFEQHGDVCELTVVTLDRPFLFSNIAGVLSSFGMNIHRGQALTAPEGLVLAVFECTDAEAFIAQHRGAVRQIHRTLEAVVAGLASTAELLRAKAASAPAEPPSRSALSIHLENAPRDEGTAVEIVVDDAPGLLYRITRAIAEAGCAVELALVSTQEGKAIDVLHVTRDRRRLTQAHQQALHAALERELSFPQPSLSTS